MALSVTEDIQLSPEKKKTIRRAILGSGLGNIVEQYDFALYSVIVALVFGQLFFPAMDPWSAVLASFSTYAVGFIARPLGSLVAGHFGDLYGRKKVLVIMLMIAGIATALMGILPTFAQVGIWAPVMLVLLRFLQGFSFGGEYGGAILLVAESVPARRRGFYTGFIPASAGIGHVVSYIIVLSFASLPDEMFMSWGWRVPFLFSIILVSIALFVRTRVEETDEFIRAKAERAAPADRSPIITALKRNPKAILSVAAVSCGFGILAYVTLTWMLSYLGTGLGMPREVGLMGLMVGMSLSAIGMWVSAALSDRFGRRPMIISAAVFSALWAFPLFALVNTKEPVLIVTAIAIGLMFSGMINGPLASFMTELFATEYRYSGASMSYQIGLVIGGGFSPLIATLLFTSFGGTSAVAGLILLGSVICILGAYFSPEMAGKDMARS